MQSALKYYKLFPCMVTGNFGVLYFFLKILLVSLGLGRNKNLASFQTKAQGGAVGSY